MLGGARVLVLEDEAIVALDIADEIEAAGGLVVGPYASVAVALAALEGVEVSGAILDVNLVDRDVTPVAIYLSDRGVSIIVHTGIGLPTELRRALPDLPLMLKPTPSRALVEALEAQILQRS